MKQRNLFIDAATILSSLLLVTGFVCYRTGMFNQLLAESPQPAAATASETNPDGGDSVKDVAVTVEENKTGSLLFMVGSKSAAVFQPTATPPGTVQPAPSQEPTLPTPQPNVTVIMSGSKSVFIPATPTFPAVQPVPPPPTAPVQQSVPPQKP